MASLTPHSHPGGHTATPTVGSVPATMDGTNCVSESPGQQWTAGHAAFGWTEVNCFLRPQALLCEDICPGYGQIFLCLTSLYHTWGVDGFYAEPDCGHLQFLTSRLDTLIGLDFGLSYLEDRSRLAVTLRDEILPAGSAVAPVNVRDYPWFKDFGKKDLAHHFLVRRFDRTTRSFEVLDYLHVKPDNLSLRYEPFHIPFELFSSMATRYWDCFVESGPSSPGGRAGYGVLQVRGGELLRQCSEEDRCVLVLKACKDALMLVKTGRDSRRHLDERFLPALRSAHECQETAAFERTSYQYYSAANHARVHVKVICWGLARLGYRAEANRLVAELERWTRGTGQLRMQLLVKCKLSPRLDPSVWQGFTSHLARLAEDLRNVMLYEIERLV